MNTETTAAETTKKTPAKKATKKAAPAKGKKAAPAKKAKGGGERGERLAAKYAGKKIKVLVDENPKREGTRSFKAFKAYRNGITIEQLMEQGKKVGWTTADLRWDLEHGFVAIH